MRQLTWPQAFVLVFGALPAFMFTVAVLGVYPLVGWPLLASGAFVFVAYRRHLDFAALAARANAAYSTNLALVAAPLPELPTVPMRRPS